FGNYVSVEVLMLGGEFHALTVSDRTKQLPPFREIGLLLPSSLSDARDEVTEVSLFPEIAKIALGIEPQTSPAFDGHGGMFNYHAPGEGRVTRLDGVDAARELAGVRTLMVAVHEGDRASSMLGLLGGMIRAICAAPTVEELFAIRDRVMETITYEVEGDG
ncbi:MAG: hypothetical protein ACRDL3_10910, partial [Solirubrobacterales bacterium]